MSIDMVTRAAIALLVFLGLSFLPFTCPLALALASGPTKFGGRVRAIVVRPDNPNIIWVAAATGGLWKTTNAGADWSQGGALFAHAAVLLGAIICGAAVFAAVALVLGGDEVQALLHVARERWARTDRVRR